MWIPIDMDDVPDRFSPERFVQLLALAEAGERPIFMAEVLESGNPDDADARARAASLWADVREQLGLPPDVQRYSSASDRPPHPHKESPVAIITDSMTILTHVPTHSLAEFRREKDKPGRHVEYVEHWDPALVGRIQPGCEMPTADECAFDDEGVMHCHPGRVQSWRIRVMERRTPIRSAAALEAATQKP